LDGHTSQNCQVKEKIMSKSDEEILREEIRALRDIILKLYQWGVAFIASLQAAIFFIRKEVLAGLIQNGRLPQGGQLPAWRYFFGTGVLFIIAIFFTYLSLTSGKRMQFYQKQLIEKRSSGVEEPSQSRRRIKLLRFMVVSLYFLFPILDFVGRFLFR